MQQVLVTLLILSGAALLTSAQDERLGQEKLEQLLERSAQRPFIILNGDDFRKFVGDPPRPYDLVVFLTSKSGSCAFCNEIRPEVELAANAFEVARYDNSTTPLHHVFFVELDGSRYHDLFTQFGLQTVPHLLFVEHQLNNKRKKWEKLFSDRFNLNRGWGAENLIKSVSARLGLKIKFERPPAPVDWTFLLLVTTVLAAAVSFFATIGRPYIDTYLRNRYIYLFGALAFYAFCISGGMYNHIQGVPFSQPNHDGSMSFINPSSGTQYGAESWIIGFVNIVCAAALILMNTRLLKIQGGEVARGIAVTAGILAFHFFFGILRNIYTRKNNGYRWGYLWGLHPGDLF